MPLLETLHAALPVQLTELRPGRRLAVHQNNPRLKQNDHTHTLIFVHGSCASLLQWKAQIRTFQDANFHTIAYDAYGCGRSPKPNSWEAYSSDQHVQDLKAIVRKFAGTSPASKTFIIAHSAGCSWALQTAIDLGKEEPDLIHGLALLGAIDEKPAAALHPVFRLPVLCLDGIQPLLSAGFAERALHPQTREAQTPEHRELLQLCAESNNSNPMYMCKVRFQPRTSILEYHAP